MRWILLLLFTLQTAMCGQKGPLTLPDPGPAATQATAAHQVGRERQQS